MLQVQPSPDRAIQPPRRIGVLTNRAASRNARGVEPIQAVTLNDPRFIHEIVEDAASIPAALERLAQARVALLVINGGDGTVQTVLTDLVLGRPFDRVPPIAILSGGKTNMIAADLGSRRDRAAMLRRLAALNDKGLLEAHLVPRRLIDLRWGADRRLGLFFGSAGIVRGMLWCRRTFYRRRLPSSLANALAILVLILASLRAPARSPLRSDRMALIIPGERAEAGRFALVLATGLERLLFGLSPFGPAAAAGFRLSAVRQSPRALASATLALICGRFDSLPASAACVTSAHRMVIKGREPITLDGEVYLPTGDVVLSCGPTLRFVAL